MSCTQSIGGIKGLLLPTSKGLIYWERKSLSFKLIEFRAFLKSKGYSVHDTINSIALI